MMIKAFGAAESKKIVDKFEWTFENNYKNIDNSLIKN